MHYWCEEKMATCVSCETETDNSSSEIAGRPTSASNATMDVIKNVGVVMYKIPSFNVLSFEEPEQHDNTKRPQEFCSTLT